MEHLLVLVTDGLMTTVADWFWVHLLALVYLLVEVGDSLLVVVFGWLDFQEREQDVHVLHVLDYQYRQFEIQ